MKRLGTISLAALFLLMAGSVAVYSQDDSRPSQTQEQKDKAKANDKQNEKAAKQEDKAASKPEKKSEQEQPSSKQEERLDKHASRQEQKDQKQRDKNAAKQEQEQQKQEQKQQRSDQRMQPNQHQHPVAANQGRRIPDDKFRQHFGREHTFRVRRTEIVDVSQPVIVYGGYNFELVDAWPADWGFDDDCYIDYVDGEYFLFDAFHPGIRISVFIVD